MSGEGAFQNLDPARTIHHRQIEPHRRRLSQGFTPQKHRSGSDDPSHLMRRQMLRRARMAAALLHFDEDNLVAIARDQINLAMGAAPTLCGDDPARHLVVTRHRLFGAASGMEGTRPALTKMFGHGASPSDSAN